MRDRGAGWPALRLGSIVAFLAGVVVALVGAVVIHAWSEEDGSTLPKLEFSQFGDPAESLYCLPYPEGDSYLVNNTYSTPGSHIGRFAYDFEMPLGAEIAAARAGTVIEIRDVYGDDDGSGGHENGVLIVHDDGTLAAYLHMSEDGVLIGVGDQVEAGDVIGLVGTSGTSPSNPHLHFEVFEGQGEDSLWYKSLPVNFRNTDGALDSHGGLLQSTVSYEALNCEL